MARAGEQVAGLGGHRRAGFTLFEMLVALAVMGVATGVIISLFTASLDLSANSRHQRIASSLAEETLHALMADPASYEWSGVTGQELTRVSPKSGAESGTIALAPPSTLPVIPAAAARSRTAYAGFTCEVYGRLPAAKAPYIELTVVVRWTDNGRPHLVALTGAVAPPRAEKSQ